MEDRFSQICWLHTERHIGVINPSYLEWTTNNKKSKPLIKLLQFIIELCRWLYINEQIFHKSVQYKWK